MEAPFCAQITTCHRRRHQNYGTVESVESYRCFTILFSNTFFMVGHTSRFPLCLCVWTNTERPQTTGCDIFYESYDQQLSDCQILIFQTVFVQKVFFFQTVFFKGTRLTYLLSFASLFLLKTSLTKQPSTLCVRKYNRASGQGGQRRVQIRQAGLC